MSYLNELGTVLEMEKHYFDSQSKIILSFKSVQAALLQQCLDEYKHLSLHEIASLIQPSSSHSKIIILNPEDLRMPGARIIYDLLYVLQHPLHPDRSILIHIEAQGEESYKYHLPRRSLYYAYRLIAGQQNHSLGFQNESYNDILDVRSLWICLRHAKKKDNCWLEYTTVEKLRKGNFRFDPAIYGISKIHLLYPGIQSKEEKSEDEILKDPKDVMELSSLLFLSDREFEQILLILEKKYDILLTKEEKKEVGEMCTFGQGAFLAWKDYGLEKGREEGIEKGKLDNLIENISALLESGTISDIQQAFSILHVKKELQPKILKRLNLN